MPRSSVTGGGDWRTLLPEMLAAEARPWRSSEVPGGVGWFVVPCPCPGPSADADRRCLVRYEADRGSEGRGPFWSDGLRLESGDTGAEEEGDRWDGGV
jgi:hypothetical protein